MLSMRERVPLLRHMASEVGNACRCAGNARTFDDSTAMRINPMTLTKKDQSSKLPATGEGANDDPHAASPP
jgi:hypothetical protein